MACVLDMLELLIHKLRRGTRHWPGNKPRVRLRDAGAMSSKIGSVKVRREES